MTALFGLACPIDGAPLAQRDRTLSCPQGHHFDIARQGYVNLLPVQFKRSKNPGDNKEMVAARSQFLNKGYYQNIAATLSEYVLNYIPCVNSPICCLDAGCGEGYYLDFLQQTLITKHINSSPSDIPQLIGVDISKWAIIAATRRNKSITWVVGTNKHLPVPAHSIDLLICGFGFPHYSAFKKALKPRGKIILIDAQEQHLIEIRKELYETVRAYEAPDFKQALDEGFEIEQQQRLTYVLPQMPQGELQSLLAMTPHLYRAPAEGLSQLEKITQIDITIDVEFTILKASS